MGQDEDEDDIWVETRFRAAFLRLTHEIGPVALSGRLDLFETRQRGEYVYAEDSENGWSLTGAVDWHADRPGADHRRRAPCRERAAARGARLGLAPRSRTRTSSRPRCGLRSERQIAYRIFTFGRIVARCARSVRLGGPASRPRRPSAGDLVVQVRDGERRGRAPNAVVTLYPGGRPAPLGRGRGDYQIAQRDLQFSPFVLVVPVGAQVAFPNFDNVRHHVYSFSPVRRFELRLYAREQTRSVRFDRPGSCRWAATSTTT